jgi:hypothetical protein
VAIMVVPNKPMERKRAYPGRAPKSQAERRILFCGNMIPQ